MITRCSRGATACASTSAFTTARVASSTGAAPADATRPRSTASISSACRSTSAATSASFDGKY
jgi:hypothetical protein